MKKAYLFLTAMLLSLPLLAQSPEETPVATHGLLRVKGNRIVGSADTAVSLAGNSLFWSQWGGEFYNANVVKWLKNDWNSKIIRAAMGVDETDGYITNPTVEKQKVIDVVDACIEQGLYVIIDWHSHHAEDYKTESIAFFKEMATKYGQYPNVIYEVYNEPLDVTSWSKSIKPYAEDVIKEIRAIDPDNLILVGTRTWSQEVLEAGNDPISDVNLAYVLHFYVGTHGQFLRDKAQQALNKGIPLFVSEWGLWGSDTDLENWMNFLKQNQLNWCNWSVITKEEPPSVIKAGANPDGNWAESDLTTIGKKVRNYMLNWPKWTPLPAEPCTLKTAPFATLNIPGIIEAEKFDTGCPDSSYYDVDESNQGGKYRTTEVDIETCTDIGGGYNLGYLEKDEWLNYTVNINEAGSYNITARIASLAGGGSMRLKLDGSDLTEDIAMPATGDWQKWQDISLGTASLTESKSKLKLMITKPGFNLNKLTFTNLTSSIEEEFTRSGVKIFPTISDSKFYVETTKSIQQLFVFNMSGRIVLENSYVRESMFSMGESWSAGTYFVVFNMTDGSSFKGKIQKQ